MHGGLLPVRRKLFREGGPMKELLILVPLAAAVLFAVLTVVRRIRRGGGCCGEHEAVVRRIRVRDRNRSHYPYAVELTVGGMTCAGCARKTENALNALDGVWASVDPLSGRGTVLCRSVPDEKTLREAVARAGYVVTDFSSRSRRA